jgi:hypothetical protein
MVKNVLLDEKVDPDDYQSMKKQIDKILVEEQSKLIHCLKE